MSLFDKAKDLAKQAQEQAKAHSDVVEKGLDKAKDAANKATSGKYKDQIDKASKKADDLLGRTTGRDDTGKP